MKRLSTQLFELYFRYQTLVALISFVAGFVWGVWREQPIDTDWALALQALSLIILFVLLTAELAWRSGTWKPRPKISNWWRWHELVMHFMLGGLLRGYMVFFLKSSGALGTWAFLTLLTLALLANELPFVQNRGTTVRTIMWTLALSCFLTYLIPRLTHNLGPEVFTLSIGVAATLLVIAYYFLRRLTSLTLRRRFFLWPSLATLASYLALYHLTLIPPVPLMLARFAVVHRVERATHDWYLLQLHPTDTFLLRPGDKAVAAFKLIAPPLFVEELRLRWQWRTPQGWRETDDITVKIQGGRRDGFRGTTEKSHLWPGDWRVLLETKKGREIARKNFSIQADPTLIPRAFKRTRF